MGRNTVRIYTSGCALVGLLLAGITGCGGMPPEEELPVGSKAQASTTYAVKCWRASLYDLDSDGYADRFANKSWRVTFQRPSHLSMTCPAGYVMARGDCDDGDAAVHPRRREVYGNGVDDNCDGRVDEPTFDYRYNGFDNGTSAFTMRVRVHDPDVTAAFASISKRLYAEVEYQKLSRTATSYTTGKQAVTSLRNYGSHRRAEIRLTGLTPATVYRARVRFYSRPTLMLPVKSVKSLSLYTPLGETSDWYYTTTTGSASISQGRTETVLRGLYEYYVNVQLGFTGYRGQTYIDGTRYGADEDEWWCSEFYAWSASHAFDMNDDPAAGDASSVSDLRDYFTGHGAYTLVTNFNAVKGSMTRGDYLALDTNSDGSPNHSGMVLDYDADQGVLWTLEGNTSGFTDIGDGYDSRRAGNETMVRTRAGGEVHGWGSLRTAMLD